jgi:hypothetical protein
MRVKTHKFINYLSIIAFSLILLFSCSKDDDDANKKFRQRYSGTYWEASVGGGDCLMTFSEDKLVSISADNRCCYYKEGSYYKVEFDGCIYDRVTDVLIEEDSDKLVFREITTGGKPGCQGDEETYTFQVLSENAISVSAISASGVVIDTYTLVRSNRTFSTKDCINSSADGYFFFITFF